MKRRLVALSQVEHGGSFFRETDFLRHPKVTKDITSDVGNVYVPFGGLFGVKDKAPIHNDSISLGRASSMQGGGGIGEPYEWPWKHSNIGTKLYYIKSSMQRPDPNDDANSVTLNHPLTDKTAVEKLAKLQDKRVLRLSSAHNAFCGFEGVQVPVPVPTVSTLPLSTS